METDRNRGKARRSCRINHGEKRQADFNKVRHLVLFFWHDQKERVNVMKTYVSWTTAVMFVLVLGVCLPASAETILLQPGPEGIDAAVWKSYGTNNVGDRNFGATARLMVTGEASKTRRSYIKFDLSALSGFNPDDVLAVRFGLVSFTEHSNHPPGLDTFSLHEVTESWIEGTQNPSGVPSPEDGSVRWNSYGSPPVPGQPAHSATKRATIITTAGVTHEEFLAGGKWLLWDSEATDYANTGLKDLVKEWMAGTTTNHGMVVRHDTEDVTATSRSNHACRSSDFDYLAGGYGPTGWDFNPRPYLEIDIIPEPGSICLLLSGLAVAAFFGLRRRVA
jgi:hypothetical protein